MKRFTPVLLLLLAGCGPDKADPVEACADLAKSYLTAPSTFALISSDLTQTSRDYAEVFLAFDAANAYGTPIRDYAKCDFQIVRVDEHGNVDADAEDTTTVYRYIRAQVSGAVLDNDMLRLQSRLLCLRQTKGKGLAVSVC